MPTIYFLGAALVSPAVGPLADRFGKKRLLVIGLVLAIAGLLVSTVAPNFGVLLMGRALQAPVLTFPFMFPSIARDISLPGSFRWPPPLRSRAQAFWVPSQIFSGRLIEHLGFRSVFWLPGILAVALLLLLVVFVPESQVRQRTVPSPSPAPSCSGRRVRIVRRPGC